MKATLRVAAVGACVVAVTVTAWAAISNFLVLNASIAHSEFFDGPATMSVRELTLAPGEVTPWHYHPGVELVAVKSGELTREVGCGGEQTYQSGEAFEIFARDIHRARNDTAAAIVEALLPTAADPAAIDAALATRLKG
jgi:quercetin dioxygenase-like cupin family protein